MEMKEIEKLVEMADEINAGKIKNNKKDMLKSVTKQIENCEKVFMSVSEDGCLIAGSGINILGAISLLANNLLEKTNLTEDLILNAVKFGFEASEKEEKDDDIEELLNKIKKIVEGE